MITTAPTSSVRRSFVAPRSATQAPARPFAKGSLHPVQLLLGATVYLATFAAATWPGWPIRLVLVALTVAAFLPPKKVRHPRT